MVEAARFKRSSQVGIRNLQQLGRIPSDQLDLKGSVEAELARQREERANEALVEERLREVDGLTQYTHRIHRRSGQVGPQEE